MNLSRKSLIGAFALAATLAAPLAFAQSQTDASSTDASAQQSTTPTDTSAQSTTDAQATTSNDASAATAGDPAKKSWNDVDLDKDGALSKAEASAIPALGQVFDQADANADGALTGDEYKAFVDKSKDEQK